MPKNKYETVADQILEEIKNGQWKAGLADLSPDVSGTGIRKQRKVSEMGSYKSVVTSIDL